MTGLTPLQWLLAACALVPAGTALACRLRPGWFRPWMALPGLPAAGLAALLFAMEWPRLLYGGASPLRLALDGIGLGGFLGLLALLRLRLDQPGGPTGLYRDLLELVGFRRWHRAPVTGLGLLALVTLAWSARNDLWLLTTFADLGRRALVMSDVRAGLDGLVITVQVVTLAGLPLAMAFELACRRWGRHRPRPRHRLSRSR